MGCRPARPRTSPQRRRESVDELGRATAWLGSTGHVPACGALVVWTAVSARRTMRARSRSSQVASAALSRPSGIRLRYYSVQALERTNARTIRRETGHLRIPPLSWKACRDGQSSVISTFWRTLATARRPHCPILPGRRRPAARLDEPASLFGDRSVTEMVSDWSVSAADIRQGSSRSGCRSFRVDQAAQRGFRRWRGVVSPAVVPVDHP